MKRKHSTPVDKLIANSAAFFTTLAATLGTDEATAKERWRVYSFDMQPIERVDVIMGGADAGRQTAGHMQAISFTKATARADAAT